MKIFNAFRAPKNEKVSDKTLITNVTVSVISILLCLVTMTTATWALFTDNISSGTNTIQPANYVLTVEVTDPNTTEGVAVASDTNGGYSFVSKTTYKITMTAGGTGSTTGYCAVNVVRGEEEAKTYYTEQIFTVADAEAGKKSVISFTLTFAEATTVYFNPCWGTYSGKYDIVDQGSYTDNMTAWVTA